MKGQAREVYDAHGIALQHVWSVSAIPIDPITVCLASSYCVGITSGSQAQFAIQA